MKVEMENGKSVSIPTTAIYAALIAIGVYFAQSYFENSTHISEAATNTEIVLMKEAVNRNNAKIDQFIGKVEAMQSQINTLNMGNTERWTTRDHNAYASTQRDIDEAQNRLLQDLENRIEVLEARK